MGSADIHSSFLLYFKGKNAKMAYSLAPPGIEMCFPFYQADVLEYDLRGQGNEVGPYDHRFCSSPAREG